MWHAAVLHVAILPARKPPLEHRKISAPDCGPARHATFAPFRILDFSESSHIEHYLKGLLRGHAAMGRVAGISGQSQRMRTSPK
jgi:hypothetical protein